MLFTHNVLLIYRFKRISSILVAPTERLRLTQAENIREYFRELLETPVSDEHKKYFNKYFGADVSGKMFTVDEFMQLFQVKFILGELQDFIKILQQSYGHA